MNWDLPKPAQKLDLSKEQIAFLDHHRIGLSDAYIGMIRAYQDNRTVFQTSAWAVYLSAGGDFGSWLSANEVHIAKQTKDWIDGLMALTEPEITQHLNTHISLFST